MKAYIWLFIAAAIFWMIYDLAPTVLLFFAENRTDLSLFGIPITRRDHAGVQPAVHHDLRAGLRRALGQAGQPGDRPAEVRGRAVHNGLSFVVMALAAKLAASGKISVWWLVLVYLVQVFGELALSPVGLSVTSKLAPRAFRSQMLGLWFMSFAVGDSVGGQTGRLRGYMSEPAYFLTLAVISVVGPWCSWRSRAGSTR